ncbi:MAG: hypothetical protein K9J13_11030 [Saprospiraceae bacterium]|nr:hypothetical protein [Saprospiraceae bacterium]
MRILFLISFLFIFICSYGQTKRNYDRLIQEALKEWKKEIKISDTLVIEIIPETQDEYDKYYELTNPNNGEEFHKMYNFLENQIYYKGIVEQNNKEIIKKVILLAPYVDGEYAESYFDYLDYIAEKDNKIFCELFKDIAEKEKRFESYFEKKCQNKKQ